MFRSIFSGVSGLGVNTLQLDVIGNNIANVNTVGFKASRATFEEAMNQLLRSATGPNGNLGGSNPIQIGNGASIGSLSGLFTQGGFETTGVQTDLAIQGRAFFVLSDGSQQYYTRAGSFQLDGSGQLVNPSNGYLVQGFAYDPTGEALASQPTTLRIPLGEAEPAKATQTISYRGNLDADSEPQGSTAQSGIFYTADGSAVSGSTALVDLRADEGGTVSLVSAGDTIQYGGTVGGTPVSGELAVTSGTTVDDLLQAMSSSFDAAGGDPPVQVTLEDGRIHVASPDLLGAGGAVGGLILQAADAQGAARDEFNGLAGMTQTQSARDAGSFVDETTVYDSLGFSHVVRLEFTRVLGANQFTWTAQVDGGETSVLSGGSGRVSFNTDGSLTGFSYDSADSILPTKLTLSPTTGSLAPLQIDLDPGSAGGFDGLTMIRSASTVEATQDGFAQGNLTDFRVARNGDVVSLFSNGLTRKVGRLALADFVNTSGLSRAGENLYQSTFNSGDPLVGTAGDGIDAEVFSGTLEQSNVDLAREFTNMILAQRGFQASARVITTSDEVLTELLNIKR
jgi:flagellar hook protein FlgE